MDRPELVVLDEPTTGLDPLVREEVELLLREVADDGRTVFFSSHVLSEVEQVCDRVAMLRAGRLVDVLEPREERRLAPQRYIITFAAGGAPASEVFAAIDGVTVVSATPSEVVLEERTGGADALVKCLANYTVTRLETHEVSLEELFLSYYQPETVAAGGS
jgi:ABC-2 type transport system ATP-binding protein